ncbi:MAG: DNA polymerase II [Treponema sp.]|jgi:DNA polymerase-2|nr:DNA polymerase II [Treponema sp.]
MNKDSNFAGFIVNIYPDARKNRLYILGRLADGRSFAAVEENWRPYFHLFDNDMNRAAPLLQTFQYKEEQAVLVPFNGHGKLICLSFSQYAGRSNAASVLIKANFNSPDIKTKPADLYLIEKQIKGPVILTGQARRGKRVGVVIRDPVLNAPDIPVTAPLRVASVDIETDVEAGTIRAISVAWSDKLNENNNDVNENIKGIIRVLSNIESIKKSVNPGIPFFFHSGEKSLLMSFISDIRIIDPDIITGWNFIDFDFPHLARRFEKYGLKFALGRSGENAKYFPGDDDGQYWRRRSASAIVPGRQVLDALRISRAGAQNRVAGQGFSLEEVAQRILGEGKSVSERGDDKITALNQLYAENPVEFGRYCLRDAQLVLRILDKSGLYRLTLDRAALTGVSLDKAWTNVVSFERVYGMELRRRGIAPPVQGINTDVSGAAGGTVLDPESGLFSNVAIFDFRSLYPTIIRTFNIDPLSHARSKLSKHNQSGTELNESFITAPNGASFSREQGLLPEVIAAYFKKRRAALDSGDATAAQVFKILMNSFYGVLGTSACIYGISELAGAITSFARKWLLFSRDWFSSRNFRVLYGDTDSLFVETGFDEKISYAEFEKRCNILAGELNLFILQTIKNNYGLESFIELRFEKAYRRFIIPPLRNAHGVDNQDKSRGRAKGYGGYLINGDGSLSVEVKGMEAARSDTTALARRLQLELLELVFSGGSEDDFRARVGTAIRELQSGVLDSELVYRKRLVRYPETYTTNTPPQVKAARALGWKKRRGAVEYLWTVNGPEPAALLHSKPDYKHYIESQIFPLARSIAAACRWDAGYFIMRKDSNLSECQMELVFG